MIKKNKFYSLSPLNISGANQKKKKNILFNQKMNSNIKYRNKNNLLINNLSNFQMDERIKYLKRRMKALKFPSFEDRWLNNAKNDIKILNSDKQFISLVKNKKEKEIKTEIEEEKKVNNEKDKNYKKELNIINIENKKDEGTIISPRKKVNLFIDFV